MLETITRWGCIVNRLEGFVEAPLFFVAAFNRNGFDRVFGLDQPLCGAFKALPDEIGMNGALDQLVEAELKLFAVDDELAAEAFDAVLLVKIVVKVLAN